MTTQYLRGLTDEGLEDHLNDTLNERERRQRLATVPAQVAQLTAQYVADGGDRDTITAAITSADE